MKASDPLLFTPTKKIGEGEREAIALALELNADALLIDDRDGRKEAHRNNITVVTTLNILELGAQKKFLDLTEATQQLSKNTNFRMPPAEVIQEMLSRDAARKQREREQGRLEPHLEEPSKEPNDRNRDRDREIER
ncbi:MAG: hypothetical protein H0V18_07145 [Pyrinomonadaceae bacterium]|nr:hypothetical protein [Pyrinomonadaceae bacterium]